MRTSGLVCFGRLYSEIIVENYGFSLALPEYCPIYMAGLDFGGSTVVTLWKLVF
jgi:hypothetical protein